MTHAQWTRRLTALVGNIETLRRRLDALAKQAPGDKPGKKEKKVKKQAKKAAKPAKRSAKKSQKRSGGKGAIGRSIVYNGIKAKVIGKEGNKFVAKASGKKAFKVSTTYVYRQINAA